MKEKPFSRGILQAAASIPQREAVWICSNLNQSAADTCLTLKLQPQVLHPSHFSWEEIKTAGKTSGFPPSKNQTGGGLFLYFESFVNRSKAHLYHAGDRPGRGRKLFQGDNSLQESPHVPGVFCFPQTPKVVSLSWTMYFPAAIRKQGRSSLLLILLGMECLQLLPGAAAGAGQLPAHQHFS